ncbi:hypothetical protein [Chryseobacterium sp. MMS23-Vi53]|uniref:hypothetical protein n=1 Tax=Chryseobacterium sp. MMS23-Vi53 TaxID=3386644 RepID=UPI0039E8A972
MKFEFSTFITVASCSILMLTNLSLSGQTKFSFDDETLKKFDYQTLTPVKYKQITDGSEKRNAYMISIDEQIPISSDELKGSFTVVSDKMGFHDQDVSGHFLKYELSEEVIKYYDIPESNVLLVENENTKKLYIMESSFLKNINKEKEEKQKDEADRETLNQFMQSLGYKPYQIGENLYVKTKYYRIWCNTPTLEVLQKDKNYLKKMDSWYEQRQSIRKQLILLSPKLKHYIQLYNVQRNRMSKSDILAWSSLTKSAIALNDKEVDYLVNKLFGFSDINGIEEKQNKAISEISEYIAASRGVLGL